MLRSSPLQRRTPLRRAWMRKKPARRIAARKHLRPYLAMVAKMSCAGELGIYIPGRNGAWRDHYCEGPVQVMHLGRKPGLAMKCPDDETGPGCARLHRELDTHSGAFKGWSREERRDWCDEVIRLTRLAAIPTTLDEALELEAMQLGVIQGDASNWAWVPIASTEESR